MSRVNDPGAMVVVPESYLPDAFELFGRKLKMEYVGMGSVFTVIYQLAFGNLADGLQPAIATLGTLLLFMGLKKKTRDHIAASFLLFTAAALAAAGVTEGSWWLPYALFGAYAWAMEGYLEKRRARIYALPVIMGGFALASPFWPLGLAYVSSYLLEPRPDAPGIRRKLGLIVALSAVLSAVLAGFASSRGAARSLTLDPPTGSLLALYAVVAVICVVCLGVYWTRLTVPHRLNAIFFGALAPLDKRILALFGMAAVLLLSATVFRHGIDSDRLRPMVKHAEWYFFPLVFVVALWTVGCC